MYSDMERLAVIKALSKFLKEEDAIVSGDYKDKLMSLYDENGVDRMPIRIGENSVKVGEIALSYTTEKPCINPERKQEALEYLDGMGLAELVPVKGWEKLFRIDGGNVIDRETGELCDFFYVEPSRVKTVTIRGCEPEKVQSAMSSKLNGSNLFALLED